MNATRPDGANAVLVGRPLGGRWGKFTLRCRRSFSDVVDRRRRRGPHVSSEIQTARLAGSPCSPCTTTGARLIRRGNWRDEDGPVDRRAYGADWLRTEGGI